jgi:beta-phosphoglucomutase-like phosphatase (HAD superfamily)
MADGRPFDAVLFDMDGVLVDSEHHWNEVREAFATAHGRPWGPGDQAAVMGGNTRQWADTMRERLRLENVDAEQIVHEVVAGVVARYEAGVVGVIPGAAEAVRSIAALVPVAIATSAHRDIVMAAIVRLGLEGVFAAVACSDEVSHGKPSPDVYLLAAARLGVDPARSLVVEDSLNGVLAGRAAGATVVLVPNPTTPPAAGTGERAHLVRASLAELVPLVAGERA